MHQFEVEKPDCSNPAVHRCIRLHVGIVHHAAYKLGIHFYNTVSDANHMNTQHTKGSKKAIKFNLGLGVLAFAFVPGDGPKTRRPSLAIFTLLRENPPNGTP